MSGSRVFSTPGLQVSNTSRPSSCNMHLLLVFFETAGSPLVNSRAGSTGSRIRGAATSPETPIGGSAVHSNVSASACKEKVITPPAHPTSWSCCHSTHVKSAIKGEPPLHLPHPGTTEASLARRLRCTSCLQNDWTWPHAIPQHLSEFFKFRRSLMSNRCCHHAQVVRCRQLWEATPTLQVAMLCLRRRC